MPEWSKDVFRLRRNHRWKTKPGYVIFVADRGAVRFDIPEDWVVIPGQGAVELHDRQPPDDDCLLQVSVMYLPKGIDLSALPVTTLLEETLKAESRGPITRRDEVVGVRIPGLELACTELWFIDPKENREAVSRWCMARAKGIQPLISMDFWRDDTERFSPVWNEILRTLRVGEFIRDPTMGPEDPKPS